MASKLRRIIRALEETLLKKNPQGGYTPEGEDLKKAESADLITLPQGVEGTNCGNCRFVTDVKDGAGRCAHKEVQQRVTAKMCCKFWDAEGVIRGWK